MRRKSRLLIALPSLLIAQVLLASPYSDRAKVEQVYHEHRIGTRKPFEEALPEARIRLLVDRDLKKERILEEVYGISLKESQIQKEVDRINNSTRAPEMLAEIKAALDNDPNRYADTVVRPLVVEKILRNMYNNDSARHAEKRAAATSVRETLLKAKAAGIEMQGGILERAGYLSLKARWVLTPRPEEAAAQSIPMQPATSLRSTAASGPYSVESTVRMAQVISSTEKEEHAMEREFYFENLHPELQKVLNLQLQATGDVSAVIERPTAFQLFVLINRTAEEMEVAILNIPKRSYDEWLAEQ